MVSSGPLNVQGLLLNPWDVEYPVNWGYFPLETGLNVLYGLNGAGKSLVIEALRSSFTGVVGSRAREGRPALLIRLAEEAFVEGQYGLAAHPGVVALLKRHQRPEDAWDDLHEGYAYTAGDLPSRVVNEMEARFENDTILPVGTSARSLAEEVWGQQTFLVGPEGRESPSWTVVPMVTLDPQSPAIESAAALFDSQMPGTFNSPPLVLTWTHHSEMPPRRQVQPSWFKLDTGGWPTDALELPLIDPWARDLDSDTRDLFEEVANRLPEPEMAAPEDPMAEPYQAVGLSLRDLMDRLARLIAGQRDSGDERLILIRGLAEQYDRATWLSVGPQGQLSADCGAVAVASLLERRANEYFTRLLLDAPILELNLGGPATWLRGNPMRWGARRRADGRWLPIQDLSEGERRWAQVAIALAVALVPRGLLLLDEPEKALHRSAERYMARGITEIARELGLAVVAATHSPALLDEMHAHVTLVKRSDERVEPASQLAQLSALGREELTSFGLLPSDLLNRTKGFLLVEGQHDLIVFQELLGRELDELRVEVLPMRGAGRLASTLDSRVLYDFTDAHMFVVLDALRGDVIQDIWNEGRRLAKTQGKQIAIDHTRRRLADIGAPEAEALSLFMTRALERDLAERHTPLTLSALDILDYLPVGAFVPGAESWAALRDELARSQGSIPSGTKFKVWLRNTKRADLSDDHLRAVCREMRTVPEEFRDQLSQMRSVLAAD